MRETAWLLLTSMCCCVASAGQINGRFYLEKKTFARGEPVFLYFEASNSGREPEDILNADPYSFCAGYEIQVSNDPSPTSSCPLLGHAGSCFLGSMTLQPGAQHTERILLNFEHDVALPGDYVVEARRLLRHGPDGANVLSPSASLLEVRERVLFRVERNTAFDYRELQNLLIQLEFSDVAKRSETARTLASLAPLSLEEALLGFAKTEALKNWAPLAMHRLHTPRSMAVLAEMVRNEKPETNVHLEAVRYLASSGDPQWFPALMALARKYPGGGYLYPAAENGGDRAVPILIELMRSNTGLTRQVAISALAYTGSRAANPALLDLLGSSDTDASERALYGLQYLTHQKVGGMKISPQSQYPIWRRWWSRYGARARIYNPTECGEFALLE